MDEDDALDSLTDLLDDADLVLGIVEILRYITPTGEDLLVYRSVDPAGVDLPLIEAMGMLRLAEDAIIRAACGQFPPAE